MKQNLPRKAFVVFCVFSGQTLITEHARIAGNRRPKKYLRETRRIWPIRITRIWKNCIPNISAIRVIRGHDPWDLVLGIWDLLTRAALPRKSLRALRSRGLPAAAIPRTRTNLLLGRARLW